MGKVLARSLVEFQDLFLSKLPASATSSVGVGLATGAEAGDVIGHSDDEVGVEVREGLIEVNVNLFQLLAVRRSM